jgi:hypothetical protein
VGYPFDHFPPKEELWTYFPSIYKPTLLVLVTFLMLDFFFFFSGIQVPLGSPMYEMLDFRISVEKTISKNNFFSKYFHIKRGEKNLAQFFAIGEFGFWTTIGMAL